VATRLSGSVKSSDIVARLSADRFALVLQGPISDEEVDGIARRILLSLGLSHFLAGSPLHLRASIGITLCPIDGADVPTLLRNAELALDRAKANGGNSFVFFDLALSEAAERRRHLENDLRLAINKAQFVLYYQPIVDLRAHSLAGAEALIRWNHPERGLVPPDAFIPLAEESGLINDIGLWTLEVVCAQLARWQAAGLDRSISLNVSARQIPLGLPVATLLDAVKRHDIHPARLALEITEGVLLTDTSKALEWLSAIRSEGFRIYLDDFGTGYSSLSYLKRFPVDTLKIDKSFVHDMTQENSDRTLVEAIVAMAGSLGLSVIAEGVEKAEQVSILRHLHCRYVQGYFFSRPVPIEDFEVVAQRLTSQLSLAEVAYS
jgi:EAL domain-containing protein (putative c-di-GMP-specific phosphodiesterase class I)